MKKILACGIIALSFIANATPIAESAEPIDLSIIIEEEPTVQELGEFKITAYCPCEKCCGKNDGITATGIKAKEGRTIAVDPNIIPYGTKVLIDDKEYVAEDCGGAIKQKRIDIFFESHKDALNFGVKYANVSILQ